MRLRFDYNSAEDDVNVTMLPSNTNSSSASTQHNEEIVQQYQEYDEEDIDEAATEEFHNFEVNDVVNDQKYQPHSVTPVQHQPPVIAAITSNARSLFTQPTNNHKSSQTHSTKKSSAHTEIVNMSNEDTSIIELNANNVTVISSSTPSTALTTNTPSNSSCSSLGTASNTHFVNSADDASTTVNTLNKPSMAMPVVRDQWDAFGELVATEFRNLNSDISRKKLKRKIMQAMLEVGEEDDAL